MQIKEARKGSHAIVEYVACWPIASLRCSAAAASVKEQSGLQHRTLTACAARCSRLKLAIPPRSHPMRAHQPTAGRSKPRPDHRTFDLNDPDRNWGLGRE